MFRYFIVHDLLNTTIQYYSTIPHHNGSVWAGQRVPDLNGERRFLRGGSDQDVLSLEEDQMEDHGHTVDDPGHTHAYVDHYTGIKTYTSDADKILHTLYICLKVAMKNLVIRDLLMRITKLNAGIVLTTLHLILEDPE